MTKKAGKIHIGIGGWTYEPWRGVFYPDKLPQRQELEYAASKLTSIEINGTFYGSQKPESFRNWKSEVPDGFVFALKGTRFVTNRRVLFQEKVVLLYDSRLESPLDVVQSTSITTSQCGRCLGFGAGCLTGGGVGGCGPVRMRLSSSSRMLRSATRC